ncbi:hypothetical protein HYH02_005060 [Chlamydomonas schloesseri]|uniref:Uncharacterized protein n=1 Tax=Chlamydomonas schloesseri TaxID=2026947 RepID=A0A835WNM3_9CHLO|nr:hypothetical protein HYH02_005060 [Chlamydomonas schloesseri]|eukprot:KAG2450559.1 hypothetical protein HYH02_005060 [Chlamydomonas schloesseri]
MGQRAYAKLQYDLPLVSVEELQGLAETLRCSLQLKSGQPPLALTSKLLENVVAGARAPPAPPAGAAPAAAPVAAPVAAAEGAAESEGAAAATGEASAAPGATGGAPSPSSKPAPSPGTASTLVTGTTSTTDAAATTANADAHTNTNTSSAAATAAAPPSGSSNGSSSLLDPALLQADRGQLCGAYRALCAALFVDLVGHCLALPEPDTWALLHAVGSADGEGGEGGEAGKEGDQVDAEGEERAADHEQAAAPNGAGQQPGDEAGAEGLPEGLKQWMAAQRAAGGPAAGQQPDAAADAAAAAAAAAARSAVIYEEVEAVEEDGDDFVFEDLEELPGPSSRTTATASTSAPAARGAGRAAAAGSETLLPLPQALSGPMPPYSWPALRSRLLRLSNQVSYVLLEDEALWGDGRLMGGVFQLLRALGAHRHAQELQPLLHAYVGLVADRLAAAPAEIACLDSLWDAVGLPALAALPARGAAGGGARKAPGQGVLLAEASTCLSLVASLAGQLSAASAKSRLWQQVHQHVLPLLERCLGELARAVAPAPAQAAAAAKQAAGAAPAQKGPGPEEVASIVLVCQVLDFYVVQRPGNVDLGAALRASGVLASLCRLLAAAADLPGGEPLRGAALGIAASSTELHAWMWAVPGVAGALTAPPFQEGGPYEAHGAVWQLLAASSPATSKSSTMKAGAAATAGNGATNPSSGSSLALSILDGGATPEKAPRVHGLLQLLTKAASCRGGGGGRGGGSSKLWGPDVERAMRELLAALREGTGRGAATGAAPEVEGSGRQEGGSKGGDGPAQNGAGGVESDDDDDDKLQLLDPEALLQRRARQLHPACWRMLKQLLTSGPEAGGKTD